jgi:hypothetical protein
MSWTEIIFWLFARLRPVLWYAHRLGNLLQLALLVLGDEEHLLWLEDNPQERCSLEARLADGEHCLDIIIGLRAKEILGLAILPEDRPGIRACARIHSAPGLEQLAGRLDRLVARYNDIERLARLRANRIRREIEAAPVLPVADHRRDDDSGNRTTTIPGIAIPATIFDRTWTTTIFSASAAIRAPP